jgi:hypothetical protein
VPIGFAGQLKAIEHTQNVQQARMLALEQEVERLTARVITLEEHQANINARRRETVSQLLTIRPNHLEAGNAYLLRSQDIQPDDLESMLLIHATSMTTVMNHYQHILATMHTSIQYPRHGPVYVPGLVNTSPQPLPPVQPPHASYTNQSGYPPAYTEAGYCHAHGVAYWCRMCGQ